MVNRVTGQDPFDRYVNAGVAVALVNALAIDYAFGRPASGPEPYVALQDVLEEWDPPSAALLRNKDVPAFMALAQRVRGIFADLHRGDVDSAAGQVNELLVAHSAQPHLAKEVGQWRLHHHPVDAALLPMVTAVCAEGLAHMIGTDAVNRLGTCESNHCERVFLDKSKNASRRFCSETCQNRVKAAAFRRRSAGRA